MKLRYTALAATIFMIISCAGKEKKQPGQMQGAHVKQTVPVIAVQPTRYTLTQRFPATLAANKIVQLRPDVSGYLEGIHVKDGSMVTKGQVLYDIDKSRYQAAYNQAKASLQQASANLSQKNRDLKRYLDLQAKDAIATQMVEQAKTSAQVEEANVAAANAALSQAATNLNHAVVRAPISGKIGISEVKTGDVINAGQTLINTIVDDNPMYVDFNISQTDIQQLTGSRSGKTGGISYQLMLPDGTHYPEDGKLLLVNNQVDPATGTITARLEFPNRDHSLQSGMNAVIIVTYPAADSAIAVPTKSLIQTLGETSVYIVDENKVVILKHIQTGPAVDSLTIVKGLTPGQKIVVDGIQKVKPGDTVNVNVQR